MKKNVVIMKFISFSENRFKIGCIFVAGLLAFISTTGAKPTIPFSINLPPAFRSLGSGYENDKASSVSADLITATTQSSLPSFLQLPKFPSFSEYVEQRQLNSMKNYSGIREEQDSLIMIYYHDQTIAVVELGPQKLLIGCELIEIYNDREGQALLKRLSKLNRPLKINFKEMIKLMKQCQQIDVQKYSNLDLQSTNDVGSQRKAPNIFPANPFSILSGIIPGTKWCGTGDIAETYGDLGDDKAVDRCCRTHDLCPKKVRAYQKRYDLENNSIYTKSHCICDDTLFSCLKKSNTSSGQLMGTIYFNLVQVPCITENEKGQVVFRASREGF